VSRPREHDPETVSLHCVPSVPCKERGVSCCVVAIPVPIWQTALGSFQSTPFTELEVALVLALGNELPLWSFPMFLHVLRE
jgi:hypothetical protein